MMFYLGTHETSWMATSEVPLFVSVRRLRLRRRWPAARSRWAMDSGGFTELNMFGRWTVPAADYAAEIDRAAAEIGRLDWASPQDWMCEPTVLDKTGLTIAEHQARSVASVVELRELVRSAHVIPVLQGWTLDDYRRCVDLYGAAGIDLWAEPVVGVGTVCRRQSSREGVAIMGALRRLGLRTHGFGFKTTGLRQCADQMVSADSMAWSFAARKVPPLPGCSHKTCANCRKWAMVWRERVLSAAEGPVQQSLWGAGPVECFDE
jgi:hypothetical protein